MEPKKIFASEEFTKKISKELEQKPDFILYLMPPTEEYGDAFWVTEDELISMPNFSPAYLAFLPILKIYKDYFEQKNVMVYSGNNNHITYYEKDGKIFSCNLYDSQVEGRYMWSEITRTQEIETQIYEVCRRLDL